LNRFTEKFVFVFLIFVGFISRKLSIRLRGKFGELIGFFLSIPRKRFFITYSNLKRAFPNFSESRLQKIAKQSYNNLGIVLVELLAFPQLSIDDLRKYIKYSNEDLFSKINARGKGMLLLSGHFGNWELLALTAGAFSKIPITIVVKPQKNKFVDEKLNSYRTMHGNKIIPMSKAARVIIKALKNNQAVAILADQSADMSRDIFVDFFGYPAVTYESPAMLALKYKVPIIMGFAVRNPDFTYSVDLIELKFDDLHDDKEGIAELTRRHVKILEEKIKEHPHLWAWQHNRWKHQPKEI